MKSTTRLSHLSGRPQQLFAPLPLPAQGASAAEINALRGIGDEYALRYRHHNAQLHSRFSPQGGPAQEMFEWIEAARIASLGAQRMEGVAGNLDAHLEAQCQQAAFDAVTAILA